MNEAVTIEHDTNPNYDKKFCLEVVVVLIKNGYTDIEGIII